MEAGMVTPAPALVRFSGIQKTYDGEHLVVKNLDLDIRKGEFVTLLGPSGSGKTTTLMMLAGFEVPTHGEIYLADRPIKNVPPHKRDIGMVFQNYALFPHLTIAENIAFPLSVRNTNKAEAQERVRAALRMIKMENLAQRRPGQLSGGQQQRVALARALVFNPQLVLMDEPLGALDKRLREQMQLEIKQLHETMGITVVYVTHDQSEALALSHEIAVMNQGRIQQIARPRDNYENPANQFVADFVGNTNFLDGVVARTEAGERYVIRTDIGEITVKAPRPMNADDRIAISIRPEDVGLLESCPPGENVWRATVEQKVFLGESIDFRVTIGARSLLSRQHPTLRTPVGGSIFVRVNPEKCVVFSAS
jgi:putative spermidine/putrescine transport system ATP-binding protein